LPNEIIAINFNLYEDGNDNWSLELVGTESFDEDDEDWACDEVFDTRDTPLTWQKKAGWSEILDEMKKVIELYLEKGQYSDVLKSYQGIGVGFVDGNLEIVYPMTTRSNTPRGCKILC